MNGHPALAYVVALQQLDERRQPSPRRQTTDTAQRSRTIRLGSYRLTLTKEARRVPRTV